jgi:TrmH family RNA methyltransferase
MQAVSDTQTPQGVLAVIDLRKVDLPEKLDFILIPDGVSDPGNLGAMLRTAAAAGVQAVFLPPGAADPFAPKVLRAGMGAQFHLPIFSFSWAEIKRQVHQAALRVFLAEADGNLVYTQSDFRQPLALIVGGEAAGASAPAQAMAHHRVCIPMPGGGESLNAAIAAAILSFEVVRQRTITTP